MFHTYYSLLVHGAEAFKKSYRTSSDNATIRPASHSTIYGVEPKLILFCIDLDARRMAQSARGLLQEQSG
jgi:hypothetical protein